ncbi:hypothetical protein CLV24_104227 [Pontibacter ummariensis]|uniref:DUF4168 domain-containing protein n=1 Tax=Pontibacter ummariensis TaxID=1610492 RepID=A0A239DII5_9BACT|nr:hypothetical protein [Pontibacter ummariensis]PRY14415.1 hypothetical protein CLV24_104227 [Pontibacter ummariensis]SNS31464.1 hypothetical protein SAMN06296052_104226 [Pontibacter ummariensis]
MKKALLITCVMCGSILSASASGNKKITENKNKKTATVTKKAAAVVENRANHLSDQMIRELGLNNYQSRKVREINMEVVAQKMAVEQEFAGNQALIEEKCKAICDVRDRELEDVLSTRQYNTYFGNRPAYNQVEQEFMANLAKQNKTQEIATSTDSKSANSENTITLN